MQQNKTKFTIRKGWRYLDKSGYHPDMDFIEEWTDDKQEEDSPRSTRRRIAWRRGDE